MARFIRQFCVLFWKNWLCRLRKPVLSLSEILWPCLLFLILVGVRAQHAPRRRENCYLEPRTLPSGGLFPFIQSLFCDVGSKCQSKEYTGAETDSRKSRLGFREQSGNSLLTQIQDLGTEVKKTMEQASSLQTELNDLFGQSGINGQLGLGMLDLNQVEEFIYKAERIHNETYTWDILFNLPKLLETLMNEDFLSRGTRVMADTVMDLKRLTESLKDLSNPSNQSLYLVLDTSFNLTISALNILHDVSTRDMKQHLTLVDFLRYPERIQMVLKFWFKLDPVMTEQLLNTSIPLLKYTILLNKQEFQKYLCTEMRQFVNKSCSELDNMSRYLFYNIDKLRIVKQVFNQWHSSGLFDYLLTTFDQMSAALMRLSTNNQDTASSAQQILYLLRDLIYLTVQPISNTSSEETQKYLEKIQGNLQSLPQWPQIEKTLATCKSLRNVIYQTMDSVRAALNFLKKVSSTLGVNIVDRMMLDVDILMTEIKTILTQNITVTCNDMVLKMKGVLNLPEEPFLTQVLTVITCGHQLSSDPWNVTEHFPSLKRWVESLHLLQSVAAGQQDIQVTIPDLFREWQELIAAFDTNNNFYNEFFRNLTDNMTVTSELWKEFQFNTFQEHLLWNLAFDIFDALGSAVESSDFWPWIEKYIRGMCWLMENSNHPLTGYGNFSGSNCVKGEINWRNLFNETLIFVQNAGSDSDTLRKRFLNATLKFLNLNNIIKLNADDVQIISQSFGNFGEGDYVFDNVQGLQIVVKVILENIPLWMNKYIGPTDETSSIMQALLELSQVNSVDLFIYRMKFFMNQWSKGQSPQFREMVNILLRVLQKELPNLMITSPFQNTIDRFNAMWSSLQQLLIHNSTETLTRSLNFFWNFTSTVWIGSTKTNIDYLDVAKMFLHYLNNLRLLSQEQLAAVVDAINGLKNASIIASSTQNLLQLQGVELQLFRLLRTIAVENKTEQLETFYNIIHAVSQLSNVTELSSMVAAANNISEDISTFFEQFSSDDIGKALETIANIAVVFHSMSNEDLTKSLLDLYLYVQSQIQGQTEITGPALQQINETIGKLTEAFQNNTNNISCLMLQALQSSSVPISDIWLRKYCSIHNTGRKIRSLQIGLNSQSIQNLYKSLVEQMINSLTYTNRETAFSSLSCTADLFLSWTQIVKGVAVRLDLDLQVVNFLHIALIEVSQELNQTSVCTKHLLINNSTAALKFFLENITSTNGFNLQNLYQMPINRFIILQHAMSTAFPILMDNKELHRLVEIMENVFSLFQSSNLNALNSISKFIDALRPIWSLYDPQQEKLYSVLHTFANLNPSADLESIKVAFREILLFSNNSFNIGYLDHSVQYLKEFLNLIAKYENTGGQFPYKDSVVLIKQLIHSKNPNTGEKEWGKLLQWLNVLTHTNLSVPSLSFLSDITIVPIFRLNISEIDEVMWKTEEAIFKVLNLTERFHGLNASDVYYYDVIALLEMIFPNSYPYKNSSVQVLKMSIELAYSVFNDENMSYDLTEQLIKQVQSMVNGSATAEELFGYLSKLISGNVLLSRWYSVDSEKLLSQQLQTLSTILSSDQNIQQFSLLLHKLILMMNQSAYLTSRPEKISNMLFGTLNSILYFNKRIAHNLSLTEAINVLLSKTAVVSYLSSNKSSEQDLNTQDIKLTQLIHQTVQFTEELDEVLKPKCQRNLTMIQAIESFYLLIDYINNSTFNNSLVVDKQVIAFINGLERFPLSQIRCAVDVMNSTGAFLMTIQQIVDNRRIPDTEQFLQFSQSAARMLHSVSETLNAHNDTTAAVQAFILLRNESSYLATILNSTNYIAVKTVLRMTDNLIGHLKVVTNPSPGSFFQQLLLCLDSFSKLLELVEIPREITEELKGFSKLLQFFHPYVNKSLTLEVDSVFNIAVFVLQHLNSINEVHSQLQLLKTDLQKLLNTTDHSGSSNTAAVYSLNELITFVGNVTLAHNSGYNDTLQGPLRLDLIMQTLQFVREYVVFLNKVSLPTGSTIDSTEMFIQLLHNSLTRINYTGSDKLFAAPWTSLFNDKLVHRMLSLLLDGFVQHFSSVDQITLTDNITYIIYNLTTTLLSTRDIYAINDHLEEMNSELTRLFKNVSATGDRDAILNLLTNAARVLSNVPDIQSMTKIVHAIRVILLELGNEDFSQALAIIPDGMTLIQNLSTMNVNEALQAVYLFGLAHQAKGLEFSQGNQTELNEKIIRLMQVVSIMANNSSQISQCLPVVVCKLLSEESPDDDNGLFLKACNFEVKQHFSTAFNLAVDIKQLLAGAVQGTVKVECSGSTVFREIIQQTGCFLQQYEEWNSILLRMSQIYGLECPALIKLQEIWNNLSYVIVSTNEDNLNCPIVPLRQAIDQLMGLIGNMTLTNTTSAEQVINFLSDVSDTMLLMSGNNSQAIQSILKIITSYLKNTTKNVPTHSDSKNHISTLISAVQSLISISGYKSDPLYSVLNDVLHVLNANISVIDLLETLSTDINKILSDKMKNPEMKDLLPAVEKVISFLRNITKGDLIEVDVLQFNAVLNDVEKVLEIVQHISNFTNGNDHKLLNIISYFLKNRNGSDLAVVMLVRIVESARLMSNISQLLLKQMGSAASVLEAYQNVLPYITAVMSNENFNQSSYAMQLLSDFVLEVCSQWNLSPEFQRALMNRVIQIATILNELLPVNNGTAINYVHVISNVFLEFLETDINGTVNLTEIRNVTLNLMKVLEEFLGVMQVSEPISKFAADISKIAKLLFTQAEEFNYTSLAEMCQFNWFSELMKESQKYNLFQLKMWNLFSEKIYFINDIMCAQTKCRQNIAGHVIHVLTELCNLTTDTKQIYEEIFFTRVQGDCMSNLNISMQIRIALVQSQQAVMNAIKNYSCNCELIPVLNEQLYERFKFAAEKFSPNSSFVTILENIGSFEGLSIDSCVKNITTLKMQLQQETSLSAEAINVLLKANITTSKLILGALATVDRCDEESLALMLSFSDNINISSVAAELCSLSFRGCANLILTMSQNMDLRCIIYKAFLPMVIPPQANQLMQNILAVFAGLTSLTTKSLQIVELIPQLLQTVKNMGLSSIFEFNAIGQERSAKISASSSFQTISQAICKTKSSSIFDGGMMFSELTQIDELSEEDLIKYNIPTNATPYCMNFYQDILKAPNGPLLWTFLKPLLLGEILYAPNTIEILGLMEKANRTFSTVGDLKTYSEVWLKAQSFFQIQQNHVLNELQGALQNNFVRSFIQSQLDINTDELLRNIQHYDMIINRTMNDPVAQQITVLSQMMINISSCFLLDRFKQLESKEELERKVQELMNKNTFLASVVFDIDASNTSQKTRSLPSSLPPQVSYTIRTDILHSMPTDVLQNPKWKSQPHSLPMSSFHYNRIFVPLQDMIDRAIIELQTGQDVPNPAVQVQAMPYPCHINDQFLNNIGFFFPLLMMLAWLISVASMVRNLVFEKELRLEEYTKMLGVKPIVHFLVWFLDTFMVLILSSAFITIIFKASQILPNSNGFIVFLYLLDFGVSVIAMSYLIATFFSHANTAALSACLIYIITFFPYMVLVVVQNQLSFSSQILICLLCPTAFSQGAYIITLFEGEGTGIQWNNMYEALGDEDNVSFAWICWMMIIDSVIYLMLGWYLHTVFPGKYGTRMPWYFPFTGLYWQNLCDCAKQLDRKTGDSYWAQNLNHYNQQMNVKGEPLNYVNTSGKEVAPSNLKIGVALRSLTKEFKQGKKVAVKDLNLDFYKGEVTALLGSNGAGKTTTMSMLTGLHQPSSGAVYVNGRNMNRDTSIIREELGVCLQHDVLFESLTVNEHLLLYGIIKAPQWTKKQLIQEVKMALENVGICQYQHKLVGTLSGGTKRKLSLVIAFIGGSSTVILDEPTSGIDPCSRRNIWDVILKYKTGRTIIFTTHHLDEADILSDRIAILENGQLKCCGSPAYLKEQYGQGYSLIISKKLTLAEPGESCDIGLVTSLVKQHIPLAFLKEDAYGELTYIIPTMEDKTAYERLFQALDKDMEKLYLNSYSISDTTLEEVFLKLLQSEGRPASYQGQDTESLKSESIESTYSDSVALAGAQRVTGIRLIFKQMAALMIKRFHHTRRDWKGAIVTLLLPVLFVILAMALFSVKPFAADYPSLQLSPNIYKDSDVTFFSSGKNDFQNLTSVLLKSLKINEPCIGQASNLNNASCWWNGPSEPQNFVGQCNCNNGYQQCPAPNTTLPYFRNNEENFLYNLTGYNLEDYLISTTNTFGQKRLGGWSIGEELPDDLKENNFTRLGINSLIKVWYNQKGFHTEPAYLNQLNNLILWANLPPGTDWTQYGITLYSHPYRGSLPDSDKIMENLRQCGVAFCILLGFSVLTASIGGYIVQDRVTGQKRLQHISGLGYKVYWITNFLYDMVYYLVPVVLCICVFAAFQFSAFTYHENLGATSLLLILFGFATLPWMYLLSRFFSSPDVAFITFVAINLVLGLCTILAAYLPRFLALLTNQEQLLKIYSVLRWAFIIFPQFCLSFGLIELSYNQLKFDLTQNFGVNSYVSPFEMEFLGWVFVAITLEGCFFLSIRLLFQGNLLHKLRYKDSLHDTTSDNEDEDVRKERERVLNGGASNDILQIHNLKKCYQLLNKKVKAVKGVTMGVPTGECFGLLGVNGAGKTTTFKMLTGDIGPSSGHAIIKTAAGSEQDIMNTDIDGTLIGYCPQYDALDDYLTGWEHLYYYSRIRGMPEEMIKKHIHDLAHRLYLTSHVNEVVKTYSGGTKRKLATALALIGRPQVLLLDEPSSGMDPESKRYLWNTIMSEVEAGCAAVLTSHSMEECEALCTRLAIMVNGKFRCIGSPKHIKNRLGAVHSVKVGLNRHSADSVQLTDLLQTHFPGTILKEQHQYALEYQVPQKEGDLAKMFQFLENNKEELNIKHYSICQATLDQVFINFARQLEETLDQTAVEQGRTNLSV